MSPRGRLIACHLSLLFWRLGAVGKNSHSGNGASTDSALAVGVSERHTSVEAARQSGELHNRLLRHEAAAGRAARPGLLQEGECTETECCPKCNDGPEPWSQKCKWGDCKGCAEECPGLAEDKKCRPCADGDTGCTAPGTVDQAWCDERCTDGTNDETCVIYKCFCEEDSATEQAVKELETEEAVKEANKGLESEKGPTNEEANEKSMMGWVFIGSVCIIMIVVVGWMLVTMYQTRAEEAAAKAAEEEAKFKPQEPETTPFPIVLIVKSPKLPCVGQYEFDKTSGTTRPVWKQVTRSSEIFKDGSGAFCDHFIFLDSSGRWILGDATALSNNASGGEDAILTYSGIKYRSELQGTFPTDVKSWMLFDNNEFTTDPQMSIIMASEVQLQAEGEVPITEGIKDAPKEGDAPNSEQQKEGDVPAGEQQKDEQQK